VCVFFFNFESEGGKERGFTLHFIAFTKWEGFVAIYSGVFY
jgi:hypothetical protein